MHADFDVVVLGAGIAGLLVAGELAQRYRVLVLERGNRVPQTKYWLTDSGSAEVNPHLKHAIDCHYTEIDFIAHDNTTYRCRGDYRLWDTAQLLLALQNRVEQAAGEIRCGSRFYSYSTTRDHVVIHANDERISARLVVDCMGVSSPIVAAADAMRVDGYYLLHGASLPRAKDIVPVAFHNLMLSDHPSYVEAFPTSDERLHIILISAVEKLRPHSSLKDDFNFVCTKSPYARYIDSAISAERRFLGGIIPVGRMRLRALDRIVFFGEAGQANPAASATALTKMLYHHGSLCRRIARCLDVDALDQRSLDAAATAPVDQFNARVQRSLFRAMLSWRSRHFRSVVAELNRLDDHAFANDMIFATLRPTAALTYARRLLKARAYTLLSSFASAALPSFTS